jgi:4-hydroxy-3-polyprenylbenzoate decarboxylase
MAPGMVIGITGASGIVYGVRALELLREAGVPTHLVVSRAGGMTRAHESELSAQRLRELADEYHPVGDLGASIASGSFRALGMLVAPCTVNTLAEIANGISGNLLTRAADVTLKERRPLVLMVRETPLTAIHLRNMQRVTDAGGIIAPPVPAFYATPSSLDEMVTHSVARALDLFGLDLVPSRWRDDDLARTATE